MKNASKKPLPSTPAAPKLGPEQIEKALLDVPEWAHAGEAIQRTYKLKDFREAMKFVRKVADEAERVQHHPDILIRWNLVTLTLSTHDSRGITEKDFSLAVACDSFAAGVP